jgi:hypothetical protein
LKNKRGDPLLFRAHFDHIRTLRLKDKSIKIDDLFEKIPPGNYTLKLKVQVFKRIGGIANSSYRVVRLSPIDIPVVQPPIHAKQAD